MAKYKKTIVAGIAFVGLLATDLADLSLSTTEVAGLIAAAAGVFGVLQARNKV